MTYKYEFTEAHPPLMRDIKGPPTEIPASDLKKPIGIVSWKRTDVLYGVPAFDSNAKISDFQRKPITQTSEFIVNRAKIWVLADTPHHFAQDVSKKVTHVEGYSRTEKVTFARTLDVTMTGKIWGFGTEIKAALQLTDEVEQQWREETTTETSTTFKADHWYASWNLIDYMEGTKHVSYDWGLPPIDASAIFKVIVSIYDDEAKDSDVKLVGSDMAFKKLYPLGGL